MLFDPDEKKWLNLFGWEVCKMELALELCCRSVFDVLQFQCKGLRRRGGVRGIVMKENIGDDGGVRRERGRERGREREEERERGREGERKKELNCRKEIKGRCYELMLMLMMLMLMMLMMMMMQVMIMNE
ncbi:hypothetical protein EYC84_003821 [Monilinia fructicola]|uniref:Uncharacterized protein n=1 Tax=Monilinia fructicola TaxID=38448 RepID=A0A5M9K3B2_MONFR|nr:hypothetical protein EYC84_003821 [Monilinia fructicola]